jgi:hypothetical protein
MRFLAMIFAIGCANRAEAQLKDMQRRFEIVSPERRVELVGQKSDWTYRRIEKRGSGGVTRLELPPVLMQRQYSLLRSEVLRWSAMPREPEPCKGAESLVRIKDFVEAKLVLCPSRLKEAAILSRLERLAGWVEDGPPPMAR